MVGSFGCFIFIFFFPFLVKFDFVWEVQQAITVAVRENLPSSLSFVVWLSHGNFVTRAFRAVQYCHMSVSEDAILLATFAGLNSVHRELIGIWQKAYCAGLPLSFCIVCSDWFSFKPHEKRNGITRIPTWLPFRFSRREQVQNPVCGSYQLKACMGRDG